jgi:vacuolar iron transporter family protein
MSQNHTARNPITHKEMHNMGDNSKLNFLRAAVLGANDGIVSVSSVILGVVAAGSTPEAVMTAGIAAIIAGSLSMAVGEYVSVSTQRDTEQALLAKEKWELQNAPEAEFTELVHLYEEKGLSKSTATLVAQELTEKDAFKAHVDIELGINPDALTNPWQAAYASALSFCLGAIIPFLVIILSPDSYKTAFTFISVIIVLAFTGALSAHAGDANKMKATLRVVFGGIVAMLITYFVGKLFGHTIG